MLYRARVPFRRFAPTVPASRGYNLNSMLRVGLVGAGFAARFHAAAYEKVWGAEIRVTGVASRSAARRDEFAAARGLRAFPTLAAMLPEVDVVDICAPGAAHEPLAVAALEAGKQVVLEKPFTGYYGPEAGLAANAAGGAGPALRFSPAAYEQVLASCARLRRAALAAGQFICYAENWVYAPAVRKQREILEKSGGRILRLLGEESHSGSHAPSYGVWAESGGGALAGKACHPLAAAVHFKLAEARARGVAPIVPIRVSGHVARLTGRPGCADAGFLRTDYRDTEDYAQLHVEFSDGAAADILASDVSLGGVANWIEVYAHNHRTRCQLSPVNQLDTFAPSAAVLEEIYVAEKLAPKIGWSHPAPDEDWLHGYPQEIQAFAQALVSGRRPESSGFLGEVVTTTLYAAYLSAAENGRDVVLPGFTPAEY